MNVSKFKKFCRCRKLRLEVNRMNSEYADLCRKILPAKNTSRLEKFDEKRFEVNGKWTSAYVDIIRRKGWKAEFEEFMKVSYFYKKGTLGRDVVVEVFEKWFDGWEEELWQSYIRSL